MKKNNHPVINSSIAFANSRRLLTFKTLLHNGAWLGFESYYLRFLERNLSVVVLLNLDYSEEGAEGIAFSVADLYLK